MAEPRTPKLIIDQAIRENRRAENLCYIFAVAFVTVGLFTLIWGAYSGSGIVAASGTIASVFFYPALAAARGIREDNITIRLLEISLDKAESASDAAEALNDAFTRLFVERKVQ